MVRKIISVIAGIIVTGIVVALVQQLGHYIYPLPAGTDWNNPEDVSAYVKDAPFMALFFVIISYAAGAFTGGYSATLIAKDSSRAPVFIIASLFALFSVYMMLTIPSPFWFWVLGIAAWGLVMPGRDLARKTTVLNQK